MIDKKDQIKERLGNVLVRSDLNVPILNNKITDNFRISKSIEIIDKIYEDSRTITFISHLGRPKKKDSNLSLRNITDTISELLRNENITFIENIYGPDVDNLIKSKKSKIFLLENLRFDEGEINNDLEFSRKVTKPFDTYIFDAFGASHRSHASVVSFGNYIKSYQGPLMNRELEELNKILENKKSGYSVLLGGAKISDKLGLIENLLPKVENLLIGGGMCFTFLKALGYEIGNSLVDYSFIEKARSLLDSKYANKIILPEDFGVTKSIESKKRLNVSIENFSQEHIGVDIGLETIKIFSKLLSSSKYIFWNGPMGIFEIDEFSTGTREITKIISESQAYTSVGGGDSVSAINLFSDIKKFNHISTGGGASLEYLEGKKLPGVNIYKSLII